MLLIASLNKCNLRIFIVCFFSVVGYFLVFQACLWDVTDEFHRDRLL